MTANRDNSLNSLSVSELYNPSRWMKLDPQREIQKIQCPVQNTVLKKKATKETKAALLEVPFQLPEVNSITAIVEYIVRQVGPVNNSDTCTIIRFALWGKITLLIQKSLRDIPLPTRNDFSQNSRTHIQRRKSESFEAQNDRAHIQKTVEASNNESLQKIGPKFSGKIKEESDAFKMDSSNSMAPTDIIPERLVSAMKADKAISSTTMQSHLKSRSLKRHRSTSESCSWIIDRSVRRSALKLKFKKMNGPCETPRLGALPIRRHYRRVQQHMKTQTLYTHPDDTHIAGIVPTLPKHTSTHTHNILSVYPCDRLSAAQLKNHLESLYKEGRSFYFLKLERLLQKVMDHPRNRKGIFNSPVDPLALNLPTYHLVIKNPMDFGTIKKRLLSGKYDTIDEFRSDVLLVFDNALTFNPKGHYVHEHANALKEFFLPQYKSVYERYQAEEMKEKFHSCAACAGKMCPLCSRKCLGLQIPEISCSGSCQQVIRKGNIYYSTRDGTRTWCLKCYNKSRKRKRKVDVVEEKEEDTFQSLCDQKEPKLHEIKSELIRKELDGCVEPWVKCSSCTEWMHQSCSLFNPIENIFSKNNAFQCPKCLIEKKELYDKISQMSKRPSYHAKSLPSNKLSDFLELYLSEMLQELGHHDIIQSLTVRVVSNTRKQYKIPDSIHDLFSSSNCGFNVDECNGYASQLSYMSKAVLLFQKHDGIDVCVFIMYLQEFDQCAKNNPNYGKVYISYLDSVKYMKPAVIRTVVYHYLLVGYLDFSRRRGFKQAHIWSCPPQRSVSYVFWCHPYHQRTPSADHLGLWYKNMLQIAIDKGVVESYTTFLQYYLNYTQDDPEKDNTIIETSSSFSILRHNIWPHKKLPPLFDGDFWPQELHRIIHRHGKSNKKVKVEKNNNKSSREGNINSKTDSSSTTTTTSTTFGKDSINMKELFDSAVIATKRGAKENLLVVNLVAFNENSSDLFIDPDPCWDTCRFVATRHAFHQLCSLNHYQFDSLRNAKYSTIMLLHHLFNPELQQSINFCNVCGLYISSPEYWTCCQCEEYALCDWCKKNTHHQHDLVMAS